MPLYYQFRDSKSNQTVELAVIDQEICQDFGETCHPNQYSMMFQIISMVGDYACKDGKFNQEYFDYATNDMPENREKIRKYIFGKYIYHCWVQR